MKTARSAQKRVELYKLLTQEFNLFNPYVNLSSKKERYIGPDEMASEWELFLEKAEPAPYLSLYAHIPFCEKSKCLYCMYNTRVTDNKRTVLDRYIVYLLKEAKRFSNAFKGRAFTTLHVGGGTPTLMNAKQMRKLFCGIDEMYSFISGASRALEVKPSHVTDEQLECAAESGFNRISVGAQSLNAAVLEKAGRDAVGADELRRIVSRIREIGVRQINVDLIAGMPGDDPASFVDTFARVAEQGPDTISVYFFRIENSRYGRETRKKHMENNSQDYALRYLGAATEIAEWLGYHNLSPNSFMNNQLFIRKNNRSLVGNQPTDWHPDMRNSMLGLGVGARSFMENIGEAYNVGPFGAAALGNIPDPLSSGFKYPMTLYRYYIINPKDRMRIFLTRALYIHGGMARSQFKAVFGEDVEDHFGEEMQILRSLGKLSYDEDRMDMLCDGFEKAVYLKFFYDQEELASLVKKSRYEYVVST